MECNETQLRVRYAETDQMGVVYHANYLVWMEMGRVEYCRAKGIRYRDMEEQDGILLAVVEVNCRFLSPARYDDEVIVRTWIERAHRRLVQFRYDERVLDGPIEDSICPISLLAIQASASQRRPATRSQNTTLWFV
ncbi:MAG: thioesterase family protein [Bryobacteraceae bacterium]